jgi:Uma2 family endonuclease
MSPAPATKPYVSYAEYLGAEKKSLTKHEWLDGVVYDMAGGTPEHAALMAAVTALVAAQLRGKPCRVFTADLKVRVLATGLATYPDVSIVCGKLETDPDDANAVTNPTLLVEVLSDSTEAYDRGEKFGHYRRIASLREYVLVSQRAPRIEVWRKNDRSHWELEHDAEAGQLAELASIGCSLAVDAVYENPLAANG